MRFGRRGKVSERRRERLRFGVLLAFLALLSQTIVSLLPMPAVAGTPAGLDGQAICHIDDTGPAAAQKSGKPSGHASTYCPVCQAAQLLGSLAPPAPPVIACVRRIDAAPAFLSASILQTHAAARAHRARAPPPSV